jgi:CRP/FNR family cyclic AMP-dependent transcriptional regulator
MRRWSRQTRRVVRMVRAGRLSSLSRGDVRRVVRAGRVVRVPAGGVVVRQGGPVDGAYVLLVGEVAVRRGDTEIGRLSPGDLIGEIALVKTIMHTASVIAIDDIEALHLSTPVAQGLRRTIAGFRSAVEATAMERLARDDAGHA